MTADFKVGQNDPPKLKNYRVKGKGLSFFICLTFYNYCYVRETNCHLMFVFVLKVS